MHDSEVSEMVVDVSLWLLLSVEIPTLFIPSVSR